MDRIKKPIGMNLTRRDAIKILTAGTAAVAVGRGICQAAESPKPPRLKDLFHGQFQIGTSVDSPLPASCSPAELTLLREQFDVVTPTNSMKWHSIQAREGHFDFRGADDVAAFAKAEGKDIIGHNLVWNRPESTPAWVFQDGAGTASAETVVRRLRSHIQEVVSRFRGRVRTWDVVNEPIDDGKAFIRETDWLKILGPDFIAKSLTFAREADPKARLVLNDYLLEMPQKRAKMLELIRRLRDKNIPVDVIGIQGHYELDDIPYEGLEQAIEAFHGAGCKVAITELDLDIVPRKRFWADNGKYREEMKKSDPYAQGFPAEILKRQAEQYAKLFRILVRHADKIERVTFWGLTDKESWLNGWPWKRTNCPLLFDRNAAPKPAFFAVADTTKEAK